MGADFIFTIVPACILDEEREAKLLEIASGVEGRPDWYDKTEDWIEAIKIAIREYADFGGRRDVGRFEMLSMDYPCFLTGGMSWGDSSTDSEDSFRVIENCTEVYCQLEAWAKEDKKVKPKKIIVTMDGGLIHNIEHIPEGVEVLVDNYDIDGVEKDRLESDNNGKQRTTTVWSHEKAAA